MFSASFSSAFAGRSVGYIGPMQAQAALVAGLQARALGAALVIDNKILIGPAGKKYAFASPESMAVWLDNARGAGQREAQIIAALDAQKAAAWKARKREKLAVIAARLVVAATKQSNSAKRRALLAESDYCLSKWG